MVAILCISLICSLVTQPAEGVSHRDEAYRSLASQPARVLLLAAESAQLEASPFDELKAIVDAHLEQVADAAGTPELHTFSFDEISEAVAVAHARFEKALAVWRTEHEAQYEAIQQEMRVADALSQKMAYADEIVAAARKAGLVPDKEADFRKELTNAAKRFHSAFMMQQFFHDASRNSADAKFPSAVMHSGVELKLARDRFETLRNLRAMLGSGSQAQFDDALLTIAE